MKIGIMGGTFNPIHNAHLLIAEMAREEYGLDRVIFITDGNPPHKSANVTAKQRFEMTHIAMRITVLLRRTILKLIAVKNHIR